VGSEIERECRSHLWLALALCCAAAAGCRTAPCPDGTVRDGDVCRRVHADAGRDELAEVAAPARSIAAGSGAGKAGSSAKVGTGSKAPQTGGAGAAADDADDDTDSAGRASSGGSSARTSGSGGVGEEAGAQSSADTDAAGKSASSRAGAAGVAGAAGATGAAGAAGAAGATGSSATTATAQAGKGGQSADPDSEQAGGAGSSSSGAAGEDAEDAEAGGGGSSAEAAGAPASSDAGSSGSIDDPNPEWTCLQVRDSCVCVHAGSSAGDLCNEPRPTCCYQLPMPSGDCVCAPEGTEDCLTTGGNPLGTRVGQCPPPR
jgi:hypothetical protein